MIPLELAFGAKGVVKDAKEAFARTAWQSIYPLLSNAIGIALEGGWLIEKDGKQQARPEVLSEVKEKLDREMEQPCQEVYECIRHFGYDLWQRGGADQREVVKRRNRQLRDIRRQRRMQS